MSFFIPLPSCSSSSSSSTPSVASSTLVLPQPSLSSLAQLSCDLLINSPSLSFHLIGYLALSDFIPAVAPLEDSTSNSGEGFQFSSGVYFSPKFNTTIVLSRTPVIRARKDHYLSGLRDWIEKSGFESVLVVAGVDAASREDYALDLETPLRQIILPSTTSATPSQLRQALLSSTSSIPSFSPPSSSSSSTPYKLPLLPSSGLTRRLLSSFLSTPEVEVQALLIYTAEGDVTELAIYLANELSKVTGLKKEEQEWVKPKSWELGLLGKELERERVGELYG